MMVEVNEPLLMLNFVGLYFLILASLVYNFYQSKKMYSLLETMGVVVAEMGEMKTRLGGIKKRENELKGLLEEEHHKREPTVKKLLREGMALEGREEE
jgi:hypothetical protein